ncbi:MAG TPA: hypothetical protein VM260_21525 [Pirellula sp.]|nr:hypothetical protein [Pirellula sp.]
MKSLAHVMLFALFVGCSTGSVNRESLQTLALKSWGNGAPRLLINLPATFRLKEHNGPDFTVFYFTETTSRDSFGIYVGHNPNQFNKSEEGVTMRLFPSRQGNRGSTGNRDDEVAEGTIISVLQQTCVGKTPFVYT